MGHHGRVHARNAVEPSPASEPAPGGSATGGAVRGGSATGGGLFPRTTSFRSRRSALTDAQRRTWERRWPDLGTEVHAAGTAGSDALAIDVPVDVPAAPLDVPAWFGRRAKLVLEIGCGTGTSTAAMAQAEPDIDVLAVEVYRRGLAQLLSAIDRENIPNIRLVRGDAVEVLQNLLTPDSLTGVRVFFPDPWPKARHHKRRLLQPDTIALIADRLQPGGVLHAATDHSGYAEQMAEVGDAEPRLRRVQPTEPLPISVVRPTTKYETKARAAGSTVTELIWEKRQP